MNWIIFAYSKCNLKLCVVITRSWDLFSNSPIYFLQIFFIFFIAWSKLGQIVKTVRSAIYKLFRMRLKKIKQKNKKVKKNFGEFKYFGGSDVANKLHIRKQKGCICIVIMFPDSLFNWCVKSSKWINHSLSCFFMHEFFWTWHSLAFLGLADSA